MLYEPLLRMFCNYSMCYDFFETYESFYSINVKFSGKKSCHIVAVIFFTHNSKKNPETLTLYNEDFQHWNKEKSGAQNKDKLLSKKCHTNLYPYS